MLRFRILSLAAALTQPVLVSGATFRVPEDHATIQAAINLASSIQVDTVSVASGTYNGRLHIAKDLVLHGRSGADVTTLDGQSGGNVVTVNLVSRTCIIEGFTITGGQNTFPDTVGAAIYLNQYANPTIRRCRLVGNHASAGGGLYAYVYCRPLVSECWIADNTGGGIVVELDNPNDVTDAEFENTVVVQNQGYAFVARNGARVWLRNCTVADNSAGGLRATTQARVHINNSIIAFHTGPGIRREDVSVCFSLQCNDVYANLQGNYVGTNPADPCFPGRGAGDVSIDPCFQNPSADNYHLELASPLCALRGPGGCGVIGAYADPCSGPPLGCATVSTESRTWSQVKRTYRNATP